MAVLAGLAGLGAVRLGCRMYRQVTFLRRLNVN
jgi:hypothetical protein